MCGVQFFICKHCGNIISMVHSSGVPVVCCGEKMTELVPNSVDGSFEKHVPAITISGNIVSVEVGSVLHPSIEEHYIQWILLQTDKGIQRKCLNPGDAPKAIFTLTDEKAIAVFEYCNLHGLWKKEL